MVSIEDIIGLGKVIFAITFSIGIALVSQPKEFLSAFYERFIR